MQVPESGSEMEFREKLELALSPKIEALRKELSGSSLSGILERYQFRIHLAKHDKSNVPDGFIFKWRYLWSQALQCSIIDRSCNLKPNFDRIDSLLEEIFSTYVVGAVYEPGRVRGSEREFLTRLGLGIRVREPDTLGFPEQIKRWASCRFRPFDESFFVQTFGARYEDLITWFDSLIGTMQSRLDKLASDLEAIYRDMKRIQERFKDPTFGVGDAREMGEGLNIRERLEANGIEGERIHFFNPQAISNSLPAKALEAIFATFGASPQGLEPKCFFPHDENPLEHKVFILLPQEEPYFLDPSNAHRVVAKTLEREILRIDNLRSRYLRNRDRETEKIVADKMEGIFGSRNIYRNYFLEKGRDEKDLFVRHERTALLIECKNTNIRSFRGTASDLLKYERDFEHSVQYGFEQALEVKKRIFSGQDTTFFDKKGRSLFSVQAEEIERAFVLCITVTPRGPFGNDLSYQLKKGSDEPFPLALNLFDFETICDHFKTPTLFLGYLAARETLHGRVRTGDELNYAGYFLKFGNLTLQDGTFLWDDFSQIFDREWYRAKGIDIPEPTGMPIASTMQRTGNRIIMQWGNDRQESIRLHPEVLASMTGKKPIRMNGSNRNSRCPCGSGRKIKYCCGF